MSGAEGYVGDDKMMANDETLARILQEEEDHSYDAIVGSATNAPPPPPEAPKSTTPTYSSMRKKEPTTTSGVGDSARTVPSGSTGATTTTPEEDEDEAKKKRKQCIIVVVIVAVLLVFLIILASTGVMPGVDGIAGGVSGKSGDDKEEDTGPDVLPPPPSNITVGVYYYPWYYRDFHSGEGYLRKLLDPPQFPALGEYNDQDPVVIQQHFAWSAQANVRLWVCSWWGPGKREDVALLDVILPHEQLNDLQIALYWETLGRMRLRGDDRTEHLDTPYHENTDDDIRYMCDNYFGHPNYLKIDDRPVLFLYLTRKLERLDALEVTVNLMRETAQEYCGHGIYLVGDHAFGDAKARAEEFRLLDAITNYDNYGSIQEFPYAYQEGVDRYYDDQQDWKDMAAQYDCAFIPCVSPGFNDRGTRLEVNHLPLSRKLTPDSEFGSLFRASLLRAVYQVDSAVGNILMVNSFNEYHEDSQIEPVVSTVEGVLAEGPPQLVVGVEYEGYGELYLDILRNMTAEEEEDEDPEILCDEYIADVLNWTYAPINETSPSVSNCSMLIMNITNVTSGACLEQILNLTNESMSCLDEDVLIPTNSSSEGEGEGDIRR